MSAQPQFAACDEPIICQFPVLYAPPVVPDFDPAAHRISEGGAHRTANPVRTHESKSKSSLAKTKSRKPLGGQGEMFAGASAEVLAVSESVAWKYRDCFVPEAQRSWIAANLTLRQFYRDWLYPEQLRRREVGKLSSASISKMRQALNRWERVTRPDDWPNENEWPGITIGAITGRYLTEFLDRLGMHLKPGTVRSTWTHLRTLLNYADRVRAIDKAPRPEPIEAGSRKTPIFYESQIDVAYGVLAPHVDLQVAFVLGLNVGMRPSDLFCLTWNQVHLGDQPMVAFVARKTGKEQAIPLAPIAVKHLLRLAGQGKSQAQCFPGRSNPTHDDPERSRPARRRNEITKTLLASVGIKIDKPWQALRATCNERLESTHEGVGQFVLGHGCTLNSKSYREPSRLIRDVINRVPQPSCFEDF